jgi:hypothetical protein
MLILLVEGRSPKHGRSVLLFQDNSFLLEAVQILDDMLHSMCAKFAKFDVAMGSRVPGTRILYLLLPLVVLYTRSK